MDMVLTEQDLEDMFDDCLDEQGEIEIIGYSLHPSKILKECDPIAYRCAKSEYADSLIAAGYEIEGY